MLGPIGADIMRIFRLLSPDEIDRYIDHSSESKVEQSLAAGGEEFFGHKDNSSFKQNKKFPKDHQAKVIPLHQNESEPIDHTQEIEDSTDDAKHDDQLTRAEMLQNKLRTQGLEAVGILSSESLRKIEQERLEKESQNKDSTTAFLLKQREKMRESKRRLIEKHAHHAYQTNAACEFFELAELDSDEEESSDNKGILINKKHF